MQSFGKLTSFSFQLLKLAGTSSFEAFLERLTEVGGLVAVGVVVAFST
jgi:hypothetical protein